MDADDQRAPDTQSSNASKQLVCEGDAIASLKDGPFYYSFVRQHCRPPIHKSQSQSETRTQRTLIVR